MIEDINTKTFKVAVSVLNHDNDKESFVWSFIDEIV